MNILLAAIQFGTPTSARSVVLVGVGVLIGPLTCCSPPTPVYATAFSSPAGLFG